MAKPLAGAAALASAEAAAGPTPSPDGAPATPATADRPRRRQLRMWRPHLDGLPDLVVPAGYGLHTFRPGDERAWGQIMETEGGIGREWSVAKVRERIMDRPQFEATGLFFATCDAESGRPVASACAWRKEEADEGAMGNVHMVCALPSHRGLGLGRLVTLAVLHNLRERGFRSADLTTDDFRLAAIKSYLGLGFVPAYLTDPDRLDDHEARWSAVFATLLTPSPRP
ncbi:MAG: GNAT family N-acetyltransferase [Chloroflexota bacterium]